MTEQPRLYLSPPHVEDLERRLLVEAFDSNWIAPLGPFVDRFEEEFASLLGVDTAVALSSGTAALHLALVILGVQPGDDVFVSTLTFAATANAICYLGARPVFIDAERESWNIDPGLLAGALEDSASRGRLPKAVIVVDLYGQCADWDRVRELCDRYEVPVIEDAAESLGATYRGRAAGTLATIGIFSFNGNKIITTSGGGMLIAPGRPEIVQRARFLATQAREPVPWYEHKEVGYNYRLSNLLAAVGVGQLSHLEARVAARRRNNQAYRAGLADCPGIEFMPDAGLGRTTFWLTAFTVDPARFGVAASAIIEHLARDEIEARPVWKPLHLQPAFADSPTIGGGVAEDLFSRGLCVPSGSALTEVDIDRVVRGVRELL